MTLFKKGKVFGGLGQFHTYGLRTHDLSKRIKERVAPGLNQHGGEEHGATGALVFNRVGAACAFLVEYEDMRDVADWAVKNLPFDRLYFYGPDRPIHVSWSSAPAFLAYEMRLTITGRHIPRPFQ